MRTPSLAVLLALIATGAMAATTFAATTTASKAAAAKSEVLPWISDDYTKAVAEAKARGVPIFVEAWAPW